MTEQQEDDILGLIDVVSNLLAVFVLLALLALLIRGVGEGTLNVRRAGAAQEQHFRWTPRAEQPPFHLYVIVGVGGYGFLDLTPAALAVADHREDPVSGLEASVGVNGVEQPVRISETRFGRSGGADRIGRFGGDLDEHNLVIEGLLDAPDLPLEDLDPATAFERVVVGARARNQIPSFVVLDDGIDRFRGLHLRLLEGGVCFRWEPWKRSEPFVRVRAPRQFGSDYERRCAIPARSRAE